MPVSPTLFPPVPVPRARPTAKRPFVLTLFRWLAWCAMASYFVAAIGILVLRYAVLPQVDQWRDQIAVIASNVLDAPVTVARIAADWQGLHPRLAFEGLRVADAAGNTVLAVPQARATLAWRSVLFLSPRLLSLELTGLDVTVARNGEGGLSIAGRRVLADGAADDAVPTEAGTTPALDAHADANNSTGAQTLRWLLAQRELVVRDATLRWHDARQAQGGAGGDAGGDALILTDTHARLRNTPLGSQFSVTTRPPANMAAALSVQADLRRNLRALDRTDPRAWSGQVYAQLDDATPRAWLEQWATLTRPAMTLPARTPPQGRFAARGWFDVERGQLSHVTADLAARGLDWRDLGAMRARVQADSLTLRLTGAPRSVLAGMALNAEAFTTPAHVDALMAPPPAQASSGQSAELRTALTVQNLTLTLPGVFDPAFFTLQTLASEASVQYDVAASPVSAPPAGWRVAVQRLDFANDDVAGSLSGVWQSAGRSRAGTLDMQGQLRRAALDQLHRYLPAAVNPDVRAWLADALTGQADGVAVTLRGDLADFPFDAPDGPDAPASAATQADTRQTHPGQFRLAGSFRDTGIDYAPAQPQTETRPARKAWPRLSQLRGTFEIERTALRLRAQSGLLHTTPQATVTLGRTSADIPDMTHNATLAIEGDTHGQAGDYLALMTHSPLGELLGHHFDAATGEGNWRVPLALTVPLAEPEQTRAQVQAQVQVQGRIEFANASLTLMPDIPRVTQLTGTLAFDETGVAAEGLRGVALGGPVRVTGTLARGEPARSTTGLQLTGTVRADALAKQWPMPAMRRLSGQTDYRMQIIWQPSDDLDIHLSSPLTGLALDFPAPLAKAAATLLPLTVSWGPGRKSADGTTPPGRWLAARLGERVDALLEIAQSANTTPGSHFVRAGVAVGNAAGNAESATAHAAFRSAPLPASGLALDWQGSELDVAAWDAALAEFVLPGGGASRESAPPESTQPRQTQPQHTQPQHTQPRQTQPQHTQPQHTQPRQTQTLLPPLARIDLTSPKLHLPFITLSEARLAIDIDARAARPAVWRATMQSHEASGDWVWRAPSPDAPGQFTGRFAQLSWGAPAGEDGADLDPAENAGAPPPETFALDTALDFPDIDISAERVSLHGSELGTLAVTGENVERGQRWRISHASLTNADATLQATGLWRLADEAVVPQPESQPEHPPAPRGLAVEATLTVHNLGRLMARLGVPGRVANGAGTATARLQWQRLPWQRRDADLSGHVSVALDKGVFLRASSFSARLLELLSLQSLARLSRLDIRPDAIFRDGVRFDTIRAELALTGSRIHTTGTNEGIKIDTPVAAILLDGDTDWRAETWNLQAAVIPKLDASGAAIAAGIIVNPLVGVGALLAQWLLKEPLANAMTARYRVTGSWEEPEITSAKAPERASDERADFEP